MGSFKKLKSSDVITVPVIANKNWNFNYCPIPTNDPYITVYNGTNLTGSFTPGGEAITNGHYDRLTYAQINQLFYHQYSGSLSTASLASSLYYQSASGLRPTASYFNFNNDPAFISYFPTESNANIKVISISPSVYGQRVLPYSFQMSSSTYHLMDDGKGNVYDNSTHVGNIFYPEGIVVLTNSDYQSIFPLPPVAYDDSITIVRSNYGNPATISVSPLANDDFRGNTVISQSIQLFDGNINFFSTGSNNTVSMSFSGLGVGTYTTYYTYLVTGSTCSPMMSNTGSITINVTDPDCEFEASITTFLPSVSITPSISVSATPSVTPSVTPSISISPSKTPSISVTPSITPTISISKTPGASLTPSITVSPSVSPSISISATPSISVTPSITPSITPSTTISISPSSTPSVSITPSISISNTPSVSITPTISITPSISITPTISVSPTPSGTPVPSFSTTPTLTPTNTPTPSISNTIGISTTPTPTISVTPTTTPYYCTYLTASVDYNITGETQVYEGSIYTYTINMLSTNPANYPVTFSLQYLGGYRVNYTGSANLSTIHLFNGPGSSSFDLYWYDPFQGPSSSYGYIRAGWVDPCSSQLDEPLYYYYVTGTIPPSVTPTISVTPSVTPSITPTISFSKTPSVSVTPSISISNTPSISVTPSVSISNTPSVSVTPSISISKTPSISVTPSISTTPAASVTPSVTPSTSAPLYTYLRYDVNTGDCTTSNPQPFYSLTNYSNGYYYLNGDFGTYYYISSNPHTNYTNQITAASATSCTPPSATPSPTPAASSTPSVTPSVTPTPSVSLTPAASSTPAASVTPTPTSTPGPSYYYYTADRATCGICTVEATVTIRSSTPLSIGSWYSEGTKSYSPIGSTSGPSYSYDVDGIIYTQASDCQTACDNY